MTAPKETGAKPAHGWTVTLAIRDHEAMTTHISADEAANSYGAVTKAAAAAAMAHQSEDIAFLGVLAEFQQQPKA